MLGINDKDYSITFGLYFIVEWVEPRLNLSLELWGNENVASKQELVPGELLIVRKLKTSVCFSKSGVDKKCLGLQYFYLQPEDF